MRLQEKMVTIALREGGGAALEGVFLAGAGDDDRCAVIAPPHPLYGGSLDSPVVSELAFACHKSGIASLRFNWRGVGASAGEPSGDADDADQDFGSALDHAGEGAAGGLLACGYSFGAAAAVRAAERTPRVQRLVLVAPPPALVAPARIAALRARVLVLTGDRDDFVPLGALQGGLAQAANVRLEVLAGADHFFGAGTRALAALTSDWLAGGSGTLVA